MSKIKNFIQNLGLQSKDNEVANFFGLEAKNFVSFVGDRYRIDFDFFISIAKIPENGEKFCAVLFQFNSRENLNFISANLTELKKNFGSSIPQAQIFFALILRFWQQELNMHRIRLPASVQDEISMFSNRILIMSDDEEILQDIRQALHGETKSNVATFVQRLVKVYHIGIQQIKGLNLF